MIMGVIESYIENGLRCLGALYPNETVMTRARWDQTTRADLTAGTQALHHLVSDPNRMIDLA
jgi:hypothetical protein